MRERLPKAVYKELRKTIEMGKELNPAIADTVANAMKDWAIEKGATHYTHWFQPMTGITAEKHDSFINPTADGVEVVFPNNLKILSACTLTASMERSKGIFLSKASPV